MAEKEPHLSHEDFFMRAIVKLRDTSKSKGIHTVYSGFNEAFRAHFGEDPIVASQNLAEHGKIEIRFVRGGVMIYLPGEAPVSRSEIGKAALSKILDLPNPVQSSIVENVLARIRAKPLRVFPTDFLLHADARASELAIPGTILVVDPASPTTITSPKKRFRYEARNPSEAKFILYSPHVGVKAIRIPEENSVLFNAVVSYEKYCRSIADEAYALLLDETHDEALSEVLLQETLRQLGLKIMG